MGTYWTLMFGADVQQGDLAAVFREWRAQRQDEVKQWWLSREFPLGGLWLEDHYPYVQEFWDRAALDLAAEKLGCPVVTGYECKLQGSLEQSHLVAAAFALSCARRWPCVVLKNAEDIVWTASELAQMVEVEPTLFLDLVFPGAVTADELAVWVADHCGDRCTASVAAFPPVWRWWGEKLVQALPQLLGAPDHGAALLAHLRERGPFLVVDRVTDRVLTPAEWVDRLQRSRNRRCVAELPGRTEVNALITDLQDFAPPGTETGTGLALEDGAGRLLFFLAGRRHNCPPDELFFAGIGGHLEPGETWVECARREAAEEVGVGVEISSADETWMLTRTGEFCPTELMDEPRPLALYEMIHPAGTPRAGALYRLVIYRGRLTGAPRELPPDEVGGVIAVTREQLRRGSLTAAELVAGGGALVAGQVDPAVRLYPIGTALALARLLEAGAPV